MDGKEPANNAAPARNKGGRPKGSPNKLTTQGRAVMQALFEATKDEAKAKLAAIEDPADWLGCWLKIAKFCVPELQRTEVTGEGGDPIQIVVKKYAREP